VIQKNKGRSLTQEKTTRRRESQGENKYKKIGGGARRYLDSVGVGNQKNGENPAEREVRGPWENSRVKQKRRIYRRSGYPKGERKSIGWGLTLQERRGKDRKRTSWGEKRGA